MARYDALLPSLQPFGITREEAAALIRISPSKFDMLVKDGRMPAPREVDNCIRWDWEEVRAAWRSFPRRGEVAQDTGSAWDKALAR